MIYEDEAAALSTGLPAQLCLKGGFNQALIALYASTRLVDIYKREADFFACVAPTITRMDLPKCHGTATNAAQGIVALDDLQHLGMIFGEPTQAWPVSRVRAGVAQLAVLHASTWDARYSWLTNQYDTTTLALCGMWEPIMEAEGRPLKPEGWSEGADHGGDAEVASCAM